MKSKGYIVNVPDVCPDDLDEAMKMLGKVKYTAYGHQVFFVYQGYAFDNGWRAMYRNAAKIEKQPETKSKTPLGACRKMHKFLCKLKKDGIRI